jgi:hypothetical protein
MTNQPAIAKMWKTQKERDVAREDKTSPMGNKNKYVRNPSHKGHSKRMNSYVLRDFWL